jgi:hypothetical protein
VRFRNPIDSFYRWLLPEFPQRVPYAWVWFRGGPIDGKRLRVSRGCHTFYVPIGRRAVARAYNANTLAGITVPVLDKTAYVRTGPHTFRYNGTVK